MFIMTIKTVPQNMDADPDGFLRSIGFMEYDVINRQPGDFKKLCPVVFRNLRFIDKFLLLGRQSPSSPKHINTSLFTERELLFSKDLHGGIDPFEDGRRPSYGTYSVAVMLGFSADEARLIAESVVGIDNNSTDLGRTSSLPFDAPSRHFNTNFDKRRAEDSRLLWARYHLERAISLRREGKKEEAEKQLGYGLHSLQDAFAHAQLTPLMHLIIGKKLDEATNNLHVTQKAVDATKAYLGAYLKGA